VEGASGHHLRKEGDGDLSYTPKLKTVLDAGKSVLKVTASATKNHVAAEAEVTLVVEKAKPVIVWKDPKPVMAGELLSASELNAVLKEGDGKLVYSKAIGDRVLGGKHTLRVDVAATKNYEAASATVTLLVMPVVQLIEVDLPAKFAYGTPYKVASAFTFKRSVGTPVVEPPLYLKDFAVLKPGKHKFTFKLAGNDSLLPFECVCEFEVTPPPPITVAAWMKQLKFVDKGSLYMHDLKTFNGAGASHTGNGKGLHLSIFKSQLPDDIPALSTANEVRDILFPASGNKGFHITLEYQDGETSLKNPHVYRDLATIYKGQGVTYVKDEWTALEKTLSKRLDAELVKLKNLIVASKWCQD
jgi:hypothetical protein